MILLIIYDKLDLTWLNDTSFNTSNRDCANTTDFVNILEWETKWLVRWTGWWNNSIKSFEHGLARELAFL